MVKGKKSNKNQKNMTWKTGMLLVSILLLFCGCGSRGESQETEDIEIFYHADDGEFDRDVVLEWEDASDEGADSAKESEKTVITLAAVDGAKENETSYLTMLVTQFNRENEKYQIELRTCGYGEELATMRDRLSVEVGAGKGPDIMTDEVFPVSWEIMDSGALVDLAPYLEQSDVTPEKYFPAYAGAVSGDRIYGISNSFAVSGYSVDEEVLGDREPPENVEAFADLLWEYTGKGSFLGEQVQGRYILAYFLEGSEDLWGMIDWEKKTCDFTGPLFSRFLEIARRYRGDGKKGYAPVVHNYAVMMTMTPTDSMALFCPGSVPIGFYFDDGAHYQYSQGGSMLMINANTEHLEGAFAFISYALSKKGQNLAGGTPVNKEVWESEYQYYLDLREQDPDNPVLPSVTEEGRQETLAAFEDARYVSRRAEAILNIIYEEADGYLEGEGDVKLEDVIDKIQNRAQLYLDERK